ncbi:hypothetical protein SEVIR_1G007300v4 [Setaria viridis]|uniref:Uncharacterized protein n=2 Tax=Setaria viridis TaxID=4556 RepID=A0A4V6DC90_SETVI|nr:snRNA-activating protein complex subunit 4-like isoform X2 [Setaria viridis]TKW36816.1 hypothetical protein SEVIR_1G007300v2 [Setaria viridis]TKW36819.1 hypothetical protein SEVIR_1G007300v2 [Setaria viridis]
MEQSSDGMPRQRRDFSSTNHLSNSNAVAEGMTDISHETSKHWQDMESENTEVPPQKKNVHGFNECSSLKNLERTKCRWSPEENELLTQLVHKHGTKNWHNISCAIPDRNAHACLSRWKYVLDPAINKEAWSQQEELRLIRAHQIYGNKWCKMVKHFPGRTNNALKEHWRGSMKRKLDSYLASGLLEQVPDLHENLSVLQSSQSDSPKDSKVSSDRSQFSSILSTRSKLKQEIRELSENADTSVGESSDFIYAKALDTHSAKVSESIITKPQQCARARKKLDSVSTPVKLKSDLPPETVKCRQEMESGKTEGPPCKKNGYCFKEGSSLKNSETTKGRWLAEENKILTKMVTKHGLKNWQTIASAIPSRNAQQCRIRWTRSLDPAINKEDWSEEEELKLIRAHQIYGSQWLKMVKHFPGRTNHALKEHWRGRMKGKLNYYLASGRLEEITDLKEDISVPESSQSDIPKDSQGSSERNRPPSSLPPRPKSKSDLSELDENADTSEEESSDCIYPKGLDAHSAKVSEKIMAKSKQRARARKKLDFLSTPVELKVCTAAASCQRPPPKMEQTTPASDNSSPSDVCQGIPQNAASEPVDVVIPTAASNHPNDVHSLATPDPCSLEIHEADASDLLDMSYCDGLMIDSPLYLHGSSFI